MSAYGHAGSSAASNNAYFLGEYPLGLESAGVVPNAADLSAFINMNNGLGISPGRDLLASALAQGTRVAPSAEFLGQVSLPAAASVYGGPGALPQAGQGVQRNVGAAADGRTLELAQLYNDLRTLLKYNATCIPRLVQRYHVLSHGSAADVLARDDVANWLMREVASGLTGMVQMGHFYQTADRHLQSTFAASSQLVPKLASLFSARSSAMGIPPSRFHSGNVPDPVPAPVAPAPAVSPATTTAAAAHPPPDIPSVFSDVAEASVRANHNIPQLAHVLRPPSSGAVAAQPWTTSSTSALAAAADCSPIVAGMEIDSGAASAVNFSQSHVLASTLASSAAMLARTNAMGSNDAVLAINVETDNSGTQAPNPRKRKSPTLSTPVAPAGVPAGAMAPPAPPAPPAPAAAAAAAAAAAVLLPTAASSSSSSSSATEAARGGAELTASAELDGRQEPPRKARKRSRPKVSIAKLVRDAKATLADVPEIPTLHPTMEEWQDAMGYVESIAQDYGLKYGVVKIRPPQEWKDTFRFEFPLRLASALPIKKQIFRPTRAQVDVQNAPPMALEALCKTNERKINSMQTKQARCKTDIPIEEAYWSAFLSRQSRGSPTMYASDLDGGCFAPTHTDGDKGQDKDTLARHMPGAEWHASNLARATNGALRYLPHTPGVTDPMLYVGMLFATFAWHVEDNWMYSISYNHEGTPKTWYSVPGGSALALENFVEKVLLPHFDFPNGSVAKFLAAKSTMFPPTLLVDHNIPVYTCTQEEGDYIITFPRAYHSGFSHGYQCAESVNFALLDWLPVLRAVREEYAQVSQFPVVSHEELVLRTIWTVLLECTTDTLCSPPVQTRFVEAFLVELGIIVEEHKRALQHAEDSADVRVVHEQLELEELTAERSLYCTFCCRACLVSFYACDVCCPGVIACASHPDSEMAKFCSCGPRSYHLRTELGELEALTLCVRNMIQT